MSYETREGLQDVDALAIVAMDGSGTMSEIERVTQKLKHHRTAWLFQEVLNRMDDPQYEFAFITGFCFSADRTGVKLITLLEDHNPHDLKTYTGNTNLDYWDALRPQNRARGMGSLRPIGTALARARERAEQWVNASDGQVQRRVVIYLLSDGKNNYGPNGMDQKELIKTFNASCKNGHIRIASIGYFQSEETPSGTLMDPEEEQGRQLLRALPLNE